MAHSEVVKGFGSVPAHFVLNFGLVLKFLKFISRVLQDFRAVNPLGVGVFTQFHAFWHILGRTPQNLDANFVQFKYTAVLQIRIQIRYGSA
jgi:hypothetical protein